MSRLILLTHPAFALSTCSAVRAIFGKVTEAMLEHLIWANRSDRENQEESIKPRRESEPPQKPNESKSASKKSQPSTTKIPRLQNLRAWRTSNHSVRFSDARTCQSQSCPFFIEQVTAVQRGKTRRLKSCVGVLTLSNRANPTRGEFLPELASRPLLEKCCLCV